MFLFWVRPRMSLLQWCCTLSHGMMTMTTLRLSWCRRSQHQYGWIIRLVLLTRVMSIWSSWRIAKQLLRRQNTLNWWRGVLLIRRTDGNPKMAPVWDDPLMSQGSFWITASFFWCDPSPLPLCQTVGWQVSGSLPVVSMASNCHWLHGEEASRRGANWRQYRHALQSCFPTSEDVRSRTSTVEPSVLWAVRRYCVTCSVSFGLRHVYCSLSVIFNVCIYFFCDVRLRI